MMRQLIDAWRGRDLLSEMLDQFQQMLKDGEWMFRTVGAVLLREEAPEVVHEEFFARDKEINRLERDIRRRIVEHLSLRREADVPACLVLMSVVKDAERIGDYCKNLYEVGCLYNKRFEHGRYGKPLNRLRTDVEGMFSEVRTAFAEADGEAAAKLIRESGKIAKKCDNIIESLIEDKLSSHKAVAYTLTSRYFKRTAAHLANICTSVTGPVHEMDHTGTGKKVKIRKTYGKEE